MHQQKKDDIIKNVKKKGGIYIKKIKIFLILFFSIILNSLTVKAETTQFYEAEYIDGIYMNKYQYSTKKIFYQKARFFRKNDTNEYAYCIEPFSSFNGNSQYESTLNPENLTSAQIDRISKIAYFGYGYGNHQDPKWYAITQFMIWQESDTSGDYYFTDSLNGNRVNYFLEEINEINSLINNYNKLPSFANKSYTTVEDWTLTLEDENNVLNLFNTSNQEITINNNTLTIKKLKEGSYNFQLFKNTSNYQKPIIFYQSSNSQNLIKTGDLTQLNTNFTVHVIKTKINLIKLDKDTNSIIPSGNGKLDGAKYMLYDEQMNEIKELEIINNKASIENIYFGKYYLKEIKAGEGYTIDNNTYELNITDTNNDINLILTNEIIKKKIIIDKKYGENTSFHSEKNIEFDIYDKFNNFIATIKTNELGQAEIILPYGEYIFIQKNTTTGYQKLEPFTILVTTSDEEIIELKDYKIPIPDTQTNFLLHLFNLLLGFLRVLC